MNNAISPLDGRYEKETSALAPYFSEYSFFRYRLEIEIKYLLLLSRVSVVRKITNEETKILHNILKNFSDSDFQAIKNHENVTHHDVKALEYFLKDKLAGTCLSDLTEMIHFGLTSEDVNNLAQNSLIKDFLERIYLPKLLEIESLLRIQAVKYKNLVMLGRTHGQPAVPTTMGKEVAIFAHRLKAIFLRIKKIKLQGKLNGAVGNYNALHFAFPKLDWFKISKEFVESQGLAFNPLTTQVESQDTLVQLFNEIVAFNTICLSVCQDYWRYISDGYFVLLKNEEEVGSSTMPQKVNPINFENSEGNLEIANALLLLFVQKLPVSRLQRDLSSSTIKRNIGVAFAHSVLAYDSLAKGLQKIIPNQEKIQRDLFSDWSILAEAVQIYLKTKGYKNCYEIVKKIFRGTNLNEKEFKKSVTGLPIKQVDKEVLSKLSPLNYVGLASYLVELINSD